jgi:hypothetical protein
MVGDMIKDTSAAAAASGPFVDMSMAIMMN